MIEISIQLLMNCVETCAIQKLHAKVTVTVFHTLAIRLVRPDLPMCGQKGWKTKSSMTHVVLHPWCVVRIGWYKRTAEAHLSKNDQQCQTLFMNDDKYDKCKPHFVCSTDCSRLYVAKWMGLGLRGPVVSRCLVYIAYPYQNQMKSWWHGHWSYAAKRQRGELQAAASLAQRHAKNHSGPFYWWGVAARIQAVFKPFTQQRSDH